MTPADPELGTGHVTAAEPELGGSRESAEPEVALTMLSWMPAGAILAWSLMTLMGTTCVGLVGAHVWQGRSLAPLGRFTSHPPNRKLATGDMTVAEPAVGAGHVTSAEPVVGYWSRDCR